MNAAIAITSLRLFVTFLMGFTFFRGDELGYSVTFWLFLVAVVSDVVDGYVARAWNQTSILGGKLDALVDKIMVYLLLFGLFSADVYSPILLIPMFIRDMLVDGFRNYLSESDERYWSNVWGKMKFGFQVISIGCGLLYVMGERSADWKWFAGLGLAIGFALSLPGTILVMRAVMRVEAKRVNRSPVAGTSLKI